MNGPLESAFTDEHLLNECRDAAQHHADMQAFRKEAEDALREARHRPLTDEEIAAIAWWGSLDVRAEPRRREPPPVPRDGHPF